MSGKPCRLGQPKPMGILPILEGRPEYGHSEIGFVLKSVKKAQGICPELLAFSKDHSFPASLRRLTQSSLTTPRERATNSASSGTSSTTVEPAAR